jgi:hypothetical protein
MGIGVLQPDLAVRRLTTRVHGGVPVRQTIRWIDQHEASDEPHDAVLTTYGEAIDPRRAPSERPFVAKVSREAR